ncbi:hypothetical protein [Streptomyces sp. NBC_01236]|uniref:hypothetical protein n=1 Tax=Streptomyces sp. NBC_01236 TaxID=2903789 RepID=UPI002E119C5C|nr:hypothetical protein OG324_50170 [Streptomyces sp. NBC_01236]
MARVSGLHPQVAVVVGVTTELQADQATSGVVDKYPFLAERNNRNGDRPYPSTKARPRLTDFAAAIDLRDEQDHLIKISKTHTFRHTKATSLLNAGVPLHVAMRYPPEIRIAIVLLTFDQIRPAL